MVDAIENGVMVVDTGDVDDDGNPIMREATLAEQNAALLRALEGQAVL